MTAHTDTIAREILDIVPDIMRMIVVELRNQRAVDLAIPQFRALLFISRNPHSSLQSLAHHLGLTSPTVSKMVDGLVLNRLVRREISPQDRRKITLNVTARGQKILEKAWNGTLARLAEVLSPLTPPEAEVVFQALQLLQPLFLHRAGHVPKTSEGELS